MKNGHTNGDEELRRCGLFVSRLEHELRSPLQAALGYARIVENEVSPDSAVLVSKMTLPLEHLQGILDSLKMLNLELFLSAGLHGERCDISEAITRSIAISDHAARRGTVRLITQAPEPRETTQAAIGLTALTQIMVNLMSNAIQASPAGGDVVVSAHLLGSRWVVSVVDQGPGVGRGLEERIFEPYVRDGSRSGSGLGLFIARTLAERVGGSICLDSTHPGPGARFVVDLPVVTTT